MGYESLSQHPTGFQKCSGLTVPRFDQRVEEGLPLDLESEAHRLSRAERQRARGAGHPCEREARDQLLLTVSWWRLYPMHEVLADRFGVSDSTVSGRLERVLAVLEASGGDRMRLPDPGRKGRRQRSDLLQDIPELTGMVDSFEQRVPPPPKDERPDSGQKKPPTRKSQLALDRDRGRMVAVAARVPGPSAESRLLQESRLLERCPEAVGVGGDLADLNRSKLRRDGLAPRRQPRGRDRRSEAVVYQRALAQFRMILQPTIGQLRRFQRLSATDRNHRRQHPARVAAVAGLVNRLPRFALV
jgi:hypothetical protein